MITYGLAGIMLGMGLTLKIEDFKETLRTPYWVIIGQILQFTLMPFLGWSLAKIFDLPTFDLKSKSSIKRAFLKNITQKSIQMKK